MAQDAAGSSALYAQYLDWLSARVLDLLAEMSPDEVWLLMESLPAAQRTSPQAVDHLTRTLLQRGGLPSFEQWAEDYRRDPARYQRDLAGFTERDLGPVERIGRTGGIGRAS